MAFTQSFLILQLLYGQLLFRSTTAIRNCTSNDPCSGQPIGCSQDQDECILYCTGLDSCDGVTFTCPVFDKPCVMICEGDSSCKNAQFHVPTYTATPDAMSLTCNGPNACTQIIVTSTARQNDIICNDTSACNTASLTISGWESILTCGDHLSSCESLTYTASSGQHSMSCLGSTSACSNVIFNCTHAAGQCAVDCETSESCDSSELSCHENKCSSSDMYTFPVTGTGQIPTLTPTNAPTMPPILQNYVYHDTPMDWMSAQNYCQSVYQSDLATITNTVDLNDINTYFDISNNTWIGLNNYHQNTWQWMDHVPCDYVRNSTGMCKDDLYWADAYPLDINHTCAIMNATQQGMYTNVDCTVLYPFLCQFIRRVEYICAQNDRLITTRVFEYSAYDLYVSDRSTQNEGTLALSLDNGYWYLIDDEKDITLAQCNTNDTAFILPTECPQWQWMSNQTNYTALMNLTLIDCAFSEICFTGLDMDSVPSAYNQLTRHYEFLSFDMDQNGAVYYSPGGQLYIYPVTYLDDTRKHIASYSIMIRPDWTSDVVFAYCEIDATKPPWYVFDFKDCDQGWVAHGLERQREIQVSSGGCVPTPFPTAMPTVPPMIYYMRLYWYYNADNGFMGRDGFNLTYFVDSFRNVTLSTLFYLFEAVNDGYIADFEICDVFVDYSDPLNIVSTLGGDACPFVDPQHDRTTYYAAATFKIYSSPHMIDAYTSEVIHLLMSTDFAIEFEDRLTEEWRGGIVMSEDDPIVVFNMNETIDMTTTELTMTSTDTPTTNAWNVFVDLILKYVYTLDDFELWENSGRTPYPLFAHHLRNATLQTYHDLFTSNDGQISEFEICAIFNQMVNDVNDTGDEDCEYDVGASSDDDEFSAVAPFTIQYDDTSAFKSSVTAIFESSGFLDELTVNMNVRLSTMITSRRRLLATNFVALSIDVIDPNDVTSATSVTMDESSSEIGNDADDMHALLGNMFQFALIGIVSLFALVIIGSYLIGTFVWVNHFFRVTAIVAVGVQLMDMLSDVFFTVNASFGRDRFNIMIIFVLSASFIVIPVVITLVQLWKHMNKHWMKDDKLRSWLSENTKLLYFVSIMTGSSFSAVELFNSNLFSLEQFDMGLSRSQLMGYQYKRVYSIVLLENIPQLLLQASYLFVTGGAWDIITATSMTFTIISMVVAILSMLIHKQILFDQDLVIVSFDVTGSCVVAKGDHCRNVTRPLQKQLCTILGLDKGLVEMVRPYNIPNGVKVQLNIHVRDENHDTDSNRHNLCYTCERIMSSAIEGGQLQSSCLDCWGLHCAPGVSNLSVRTKDSKKKTRNMSVRAMDTEMVDHQETDQLSISGDGFQPGAVSIDVDSDQNDDEIVASVNTLGSRGEADDDDAKSDKSEDDEIVAMVNTHAGEDVHKREGRKVTTVGDRVKLSGQDGLWGSVKFIGRVRKKEGIYFGIDLDRKSKGKNDGTLAKKRYFVTKNGAKSGLFIKENRIVKTAKASNRGAKRVCVDDVVSVDKFECDGTIRFIGNTLFKTGAIWYGIELNEAKGKNNGTVQGEWYFECEDKYGTFVSSKGFSIIEHDVIAHVNTLGGEIGS
eukprot:232214_1